MAIVGENGAGKSTLAKLILGCTHRHKWAVDSGGWSSDAAVRRGTGNHAGRLYRALCRVPELHEIPDDAAGQCDDQRPEKECAGKTAAGANGLKAGSSCAVQRTDAVAGV
ncbi:MAG: ATP-binding cassette domain-containing protein [Gallintestinimicrobium sp.]